ncbi:MAG TPA: cell division protein ZapA [Geobacteraceae bacterium]|nr:cell division protein ZapA [Geobacteraceae bacterium]
MGREIQVRSSSPAETVQEVESYINQKLGEIAASIPHADQQLVALLTLLNITEAYLAAKRQGGVAKSLDQDSVTRILHKIDKALE